LNWFVWIPLGFRLQSIILLFRRKASKKIRNIKRKFEEKRRNQKTNDQRSHNHRYRHPGFHTWCLWGYLDVGQLSQNDQKFIDRIVWKYQAKKRIIIIYNFSNLYSVADVERKIERDIVKAFDTISRIIPGTEISEYIEKSEKEGCENI